jgi:hypothetical protein
MSREPAVVAVISRVPLIWEAVSGALDGIADVRWFPADAGDAGGLVRSMRPAAVVVDSDEVAGDVEPAAGDVDALLLHVRLQEGTVRVLRDGVWEGAEGPASPHAIRNLIVGAVYGARTP